MPQIFPMNWLLITILIVILLIMIMIMTFFMKSFKVNNLTNFKKINNLLFKW
uniref:ATP synthase F0 subunit 8 n=1 Tax=Haemaphysalis longicornis TaxID=44386 RepID=A0A481MV56_HAELO|nr:ATP synthase F0 subunit 8 [Haemaphysalis longicornis]QDF58642.1 ATP synthase F0 subunit 8 [Haemaphysalis longicornis]UJT97481.1 ATP synthase F0 subunit 8 [Haemaphysalis longicornis]UJT97494.1 ATP synthase F0 subunit 8 [Haemaphysalis longicornis]UKG19624.1 ATP synthase F0 subunit 8 [Haemaphysalis longicornis]